MALIGVSGVVHSVQESISFKDKGGNLLITSFGEAGSVMEDGLIRFTMKAKPNGGPIRAEWVNQGLVVNTDQLTGSASRNPDRTLSLVRADMSGRVRAVMSGASTITGASVPQVSTLNAQSATYTASDSKMNLLGGVTVVNDDPAAGQRIEVKGRSATLIVLPLGQAPPPGELLLREADVTGPATIELRTRQTDGAIAQITAKADRIIYHDVQRTLRLIGNVEIAGNDAALLGDVKGIQSATITLDKDRKPKSLTMQGSPATTSFRDGGSR